jgi:hypothetical protein
MLVAPRWDPSLDRLVSFDNGEDWLTPYFVYGTNAALPLLLALVLLAGAIYFAGRRALARRAEAQAEGKLSPGNAVISGTAVVADDADGAPPVQITITQHGISSETKGKSGKSLGWKTRWVETSRTRHVRPFLLRTASGEDVRVVPDEQVQFLDNLEAGGVDGCERKLVAKLEEGEKAYAFGSLAQELDSRGGGGARGGYRDGATAWVLRPPPGQSMLLSVGRMSERFAGEVRLRLFLAALLVVFVVIVQAISAPYHVALFRGHAEPAEVVRVETVPAAKKKDVQVLLTYRRLATDAVMTERVSESDQHLFTPGRIIPIHVVRFMGEDRITLGAGASADAGLSLIPALLSVLLLGVTIWTWRTARSWSEKKRLVHETEGKVG